MIIKTLTRKETNQNVSIALRQLLQDGSVGTHEEICKALQKQGFSVNQPKVSRLLHKISAVKVINAQGQNIYRLPHEQGLMHEVTGSKKKLPVGHWVIDVVSNGMLIIIHTTPGAGALVARDMDLHHIELGILGSIAGDDTIFVAPKDIKNIKFIIEKIRTILAL